MIRGLLRLIAGKPGKLPGKLEEARQQLYHSAKMKSLGEMAGGISHEINTPLAIVTLSLSELRELAQSTDPDPALMLKLIEDIENATVRVSKIVKGLRTFARDADQDAFVRAPLEQVLHSVQDLCQERYRNHGIELRVSPIPIPIECQSAQLSQVIFNLLDNAYDAVSGASRPKWIKIQVEERGGEVEIRVIDNGDGVSPENRDRIFDPFFTTKSIGKNMGLGLSVAQGIVETHNGALYLDAGYPQTCFVIRLPKVQPTEGASHDPGLIHGSRHGSRKKAG